MKILLRAPGVAFFLIEILTRKISLESFLETFHQKVQLNDSALRILSDEKMNSAQSAAQLSAFH